MSVIDYLIIGHLTADLMDEGRMLGGTVAYAAHTAAAFGCNIGIVTSAAVDDPVLEQLVDDLQLHVIPSEHTTTFRNVYTNGKRTQFLPHRAGLLDFSHVPVEWRSSPLVHIAPLDDEVDKAIVGAFPDSTVMVTLQGWLRQWDAENRISAKPWADADVLQKIDLAVLSEEDFAKTPDHAQNVIDNAPRLVITQAEKGGMFYQNGEQSRYSAVPVEATYPTGAGDVFAAALLITYHRTGDMNLAFKVAAELGAICTTRPGLLGAPHREEVQQVLDKVGIKQS